MKRSTINQIVEGILKELGQQARAGVVANEATIYLKMAAICEARGIDAAMEYFTGWHDAGEYKEYLTKEEARNG